MQKRILIDFDGTLVKNNSSRIFEKEIFYRVSMIKRIVLYLLFFSKLSFVFDKFLSMLSIYFFDFKDLRLYLFILITKNTFLVYNKEIISSIISKLDLNHLLYNEYKSHTLLVISKGLDLIINEYLKEEKINARLICSSTISISDNLNLKLLNNARKFNWVNNYKPCTYLTDDVAECRYINNYFENNTYNIECNKFDNIKIYSVDFK